MELDPPRPCFSTSSETLAGRSSRSHLHQKSIINGQMYVVSRRGSTERTENFFRVKSSVEALQSTLFGSLLFRRDRFLRRRRTAAFPFARLFFGCAKTITRASELGSVGLVAGVSTYRSFPCRRPSFSVLPRTPGSSPGNPSSPLAPMCSPNLDTRSTSSSIQSEMEKMLLSSSRRVKSNLSNNAIDIHPNSVRRSISFLRKMPFTHFAVSSSLVQHLFH